MVENNGRKKSLRVDEVCEVLGIADSLCYELLRADELAGFRVGLGRKRGGLRVLADSVDDFIARRRTEYKNECMGLEIVSTVPADPAKPARSLLKQKKRDRLKS